MGVKILNQMNQEMNDIKYIPIYRATKKLNGLWATKGGLFRYLIKHRRCIMGVAAQYKNKYIGWACFSLISPWINGYDNLIIGVYVTPKHRHKKIGSALIDELINRAWDTKHFPHNTQNKFSILCKKEIYYDYNAWILIKKYSNKINFRMLV